MPFTTNARRVHIDFDKLQATLQKLDGSWNETSFDLDTLIGNDYGKFSIPSKNLLKSTYEFDIEVREDSTILTAILYSDAQGNVEERELDLDEYLSNDDGEFKWTGKEVGTPGKSFDEPVPQRLPRM